MSENEHTGPPQCGETTVFWRGVEDCEAACWLYQGHTGPHVDPILGEWDL